MLKKRFLHHRILQDKKMKKSPNRKITQSPNGKESGQTLLLAVLAIIVLLIAALFLFDLQTIIRVKIKSQTAADAAALAGAKMQMKSLNLIGEINLIKACTVLITDFSEGSSDKQLMEASDNLTEMQTRISFVGPLLGVGAAQQAAKNNGMIDPAEIYESAAYNEFSLASYIEDVENDDIYGTEDYEQNIKGYEWRQPYIDMMTTINNQGIAAGPSAVTPNVQSEFSLSLINAILTDFWCHDELRDLIKDDSNFDGQWWRGLATDVSFVEESELLSLYVRYTNYDSTGLSYSSAVEDAHEQLTDLAAERGLELGMITQMPYMEWCLYDYRWSHSPGAGWEEDSSQLYLRSPLRTEYLYGGVASKMTCLVPGGEDSKFQWLAGSYQIHDIKREKGVISQKQADTPTVRSSALAKPLGYIVDSEGTRLPPTDATMILPIFKSARLIPVSMMPEVVSIYDQNFLYYKFLKWLNGVDDLDNPATNPPAGTENYWAAYKKLNNPLWRHSGYNPDYSYDNAPDEVVPYDEGTDTGAGVLQTPVPEPGSEAEPNDGYSYDENGNRNGITYTYEDRCDWYPTGGSPGGGGGGPGQLH